MSDEKTEAATVEREPASSTFDPELAVREAREAFKARDSAKAELDSLREKFSGVESELEELRQFRQSQLEKQELDAGEFEKAKQRLAQQTADAEARAKAAEEREARKAVESAFASAPELFGPDGLTILPPDFASARFSRHVRYMPGENGASGGVQVLGLDGEVIRGKGGRDASFVEGMKTLIDQWPENERILRSSPSTGSQSPGGSGDARLPLDRSDLAMRAAAGDRAALDAWTPPQGTTQAGRGFDRIRAMSKPAGKG